MTAPSELAELILEWAEEKKQETFTTAQVYQDLNFIDTHKEVSDSLRYMFKKGIIARKKKDSRSFEYALADVAPDDFEMYEFRSIAHVDILDEKENINSKYIDKAVDVAIQNGSSFVKLTASESGIAAENIPPKDFWNTSEEIKESSPLDIEHFNSLHKDDMYSGLSFDWDFTMPEDNQVVQVDSIQIGGDHYKKLAIHPWSAMESWMNREQFMGFLRGNAIKYLARCEIEGEVEDLKKARHYLDKLIEVSEK